LAFGNEQKKKDNKDFYTEAKKKQDENTKIKLGFSSFLAKKNGGKHVGVMERAGAK